MKTWNDARATRANVNAPCEKIGTAAVWCASHACQCQCTVLKDRDFSMAAAWDDICGSSKTRSYQ